MAIAHTNHVGEPITPYYYDDKLIVAYLVSIGNRSASLTSELDEESVRQLHSDLAKIVDKLDSAAADKAA